MRLISKQNENYADNQLLCRSSNTLAAEPNVVTIDIKMVWVVVKRLSRVQSTATD